MSELDFSDFWRQLRRMTAVPGRPPRVTEQQAAAGGDPLRPLDSGERSTPLVAVGEPPPSPELDWDDRSLRSGGYRTSPRPLAVLPRRAPWWRRLRAFLDGTLRRAEERRLRQLSPEEAQEVAGRSLSDAIDVALAWAGLEEPGARWVPRPPPTLVPTTDGAPRARASKPGPADLDE